MTGDISLFIDFKVNKKGYVNYGDNNKGAILDKGSIGNPSTTTTISYINLVEGLKHNLLSIIQLCDKGYKVSFTNTCCIIEHNDKKDIVFKGVRVNNIYMLDLIDVSLTSPKCLVALNDDSWLWHRRLGHVNFNFLNKVVSRDLVVGLPKIEFSKEYTRLQCKNSTQITSFLLNLP